MLRFIAIYVGGLILLGFSSLSLADSQPNVLMIISDDLNTDLGSYGHELVKTPHIDALAKAGMQFNAAYAQYPLCAPSRASFMTSTYPEHSGFTTNQHLIRELMPDVVTLPQALMKAGYYISAGLGCDIGRGEGGFDLIAAKTGNEHDLVDAGRGQRANLPGHQASSRYAQQCLGPVLGKRQEPLALTGTQNDRLQEIPPKGIGEGIEKGCPSPRPPCSVMLQRNNCDQLTFSMVRVNWKWDLWPWPTDSSWHIFPIRTSRRCPGRDRLN